MKRIIYALLLVSSLMSACAPWCRTKKKSTKSQEKKAVAQKSQKTVVAQPVISAPMPAQQADQAHLNDQLFRAVNAGEHDMVQQLLEAKADVHAVDSADQKSSTSKAAASLLTAHEKRDSKKIDAYTAIISTLKKAGARQSNDLKPFMNKEPFKARYIQQLIEEKGYTKEQAEEALNNIVNGKPLPAERSEKKDDN